MKVEGLELDVHFGKIGEEPVDWRKADLDEPDPDDELLDETPEDVIRMLGFDPLELEEEE